MYKRVAPLPSEKRTYPIPKFLKKINEHPSPCSTVSCVSTSDCSTESCVSTSERWYDAWKWCNTSKRLIYNATIYNLSNIAERKLPHTPPIQQYSHSCYMHAHTHKNAHMHAHTHTRTHTLLIHAQPCAHWARVCGADRKAHTTQQAMWSGQTRQKIQNSLHWSRKKSGHSYILSLHQIHTLLVQQPSITHSKSRCSHATYADSAAQSKNQHFSLKPWQWTHILPTVEVHIGGLAHHWQANVLVSFLPLTSTHHWQANTIGKQTRWLAYGV